MDDKENSKLLDKKPRKSLGRNLGTRIGTLILSGSLMFSGCKNPMLYNPQEIVDDEIRNRSVVAETLAEESSIPLSSEQLSYLENIIENNYSGRTIIRADLPFDLAWDSDNPSSDKQYNVYFRSTSSDKWIYMATTSGLLEDLDWNERGIPVNEIPYGMPFSGSYEFGVEAIDYDNKKSELHKSTDSTADPNPWGVFTNGYCSPADANLNEVTETDELINYINGGSYTSFGLSDSIDDWVTDHALVEDYFAIIPLEMRTRGFNGNRYFNFKDERMAQNFKRRDGIVPV